MREISMDAHVLPATRAASVVKTVRGARKAREGWEGQACHAWVGPTGTRGLAEAHR